MLSNVQISHDAESQLFKVEKPTLYLLGSIITLDQDADQLIQLLKVLREPEEIPGGFVSFLKDNIFEFASDLPAEIQTFTLSKKVYVLGSELGSYLGLTRGEIFKRYAAAF